jgi:type IV secretory pathway VirB2 component (pilin)
MDKFFEVMEGPVGRLLRIALGVVLVYLGLARMTGPGGWAVAIAGVLPIAMGLWGPCLVNLAIRRLRRA